MISYYFSLQFKLFNRKLEGLGISPLWGYLLLLIVFLIFSGLIFLRIDEKYAGFIYAFFGLQATFMLADQRRNNFIKSIFSVNDHRKIRLIENVLLTIPYLIILCIKYQFLIAILLLVIAGLVSIINMRQNFNFTIPTPFGRRPFEFLTGFRKTILIFPIAIYISIQALIVLNFNLSLSVLGLLYLIIFSYYLNSEDKYFVWIWSKSPPDFLKTKIITAISQSLIITIPISIICLLIDPTYWYVIPIILIVGSVYLTTIILAKYSNYPDQMSVPQALIMTLALVFPVLLIFIIPLFYKKSIRSLNQVLL